MCLEIPILSKGRGIGDWSFRAVADAGGAAGGGLTPQDYPLSLPEILFQKGYISKGLPEHTPDLVALVDAIELHAHNSSDLSLEVQSNVSSNSLVFHRLMRGSKCQEWLFTVLDYNCRELTSVTGGGHEHAEAMQNIALAVLDAHEAKVEDGTVKDIDLCHNEKRGRFFSG